MTLFSEEIKLGITLGNTYEFLDGIAFEGKKVLKDFMEDGF